MNKPTKNVLLEDENDLLSDMSFSHMDHASPFKTKSSVQIPVNEPLRKAQTVIPGKQSYP